MASPAVVENAKDDTKKVSSWDETPPAFHRPPIDYASFPSFTKSVYARFVSLWTKRFICALAIGQVVSFCITCTSVTTTELVKRNWALPTTQSFFVYFSLCIIYTPYTIHKYGLNGWANLVLRDGWKYIILAASDVEANFLVVKALQYTDLLSCILLDGWAIPVGLFFSFLYMRVKYHWTQILGVFVCLVGLGLQVASDHFTVKNYPALNKAKGDALMIAGATLYGFSNATEEFIVRKRPLYEVIGQIGFWGTIISFSQAIGLEHHEMKAANWSGANIGLLFAYTGAMFVFYTVAPLLYRMASSTFCNLGILSSDFYNLLFGLFLFHYRPYWLYFFAFMVVISGLIIYFWHATPEEQGVNHPQIPVYVGRGEAIDLRGKFWVTSGGLGEKAPCTCTHAKQI